jgi:hypothetical protein
VLDNDTATYYDELHHTPRGCEVIGNEIARRIVRRSRAPRARRSSAARAATVAK